MKRIIVLLLMSFMCTSIFLGCGNLNEGEFGSKVYEYEDVKDTLIRFHVIANSDSEEDQELKLKVRDKVIEHLYPLLQNSSSLEESREILESNKREVENIAAEVIKENGYNYGVYSELSRENFPEKAYGGVVLPQGNYEAFRIVIGNGEGKNWWCVMFPPLCFVDITKGQVEDNKCIDALDAQIDQEVKEEEEEEEEESPVFKFKLFEWFSELFS